MPTYRTPDVLVQATVDPSATAVDGQVVTPAVAVDRQRQIDLERTVDAYTDATAGSMQMADANRSIPRARTDNLNPLSGRHLTEAGETITPPTMHNHRMNRRNANRGIDTFTQAQGEALAAFLNPANERQQTIRDGLNSYFEQGNHIDDMGPASQRMVRRLDTAIQKVERLNDRTHVVYTSVNIPGGRAGRQRFIAAANGGNTTPQTLLGYTLTNHDINKVAGDDDTVVVEIETARGMYTGGDGSSTHLLPRGVTLEVIGARSFDVEDENGNTTSRTVVQMREKRNDERTVARQ